MGKRNTIAEVKLAEAAVIVTFANGFASTTNVEDLSEGIRNKCLVLGLSNKLRDSYANAKTADEAQGLYEKVLANLLAGTWSGKREAGEPSEEPINLLAEAVAAVMGKAKEAILAKLQAMTPADRRKVRSAPDVMVKLAELKAAKSKGPSLADLFKDEAPIAEAPAAS